MSTKRCPQCAQDLPRTAFNRASATADGLHGWCRNCYSMYRRLRHRQNPLPSMLQAARYRARQRGIPFEITEEDLTLPISCPMLGIPIRSGKGKHSDNSPSLDRILPDLGYVPGNVVVISHRANAIKNAASFAELRAIAQWLERRIQRNP